MRWSWRIGRVAGIDIYVHITFLMLLAWVGISHYALRGSVEDVVDGLGFTCTLFAIITMHELGHALTARRFGVVTRDILLLPIGGVARMERLPEQPLHEMLVALAGPAVNLVLAGLLYLFLIGTGQWVNLLEEPSWVRLSFLNKLFWANLILATFNLIPAFPMDGGRVLRAFLAIWMDHVRATDIAAYIGQAIAFVLGPIGMVVNPMLLFIALFVILGAEYEREMARRRYSLAGIPVQELMIRDVCTLHPDDSLEQAMQRLRQSFQRDFPVIDADHVIGLLTRDRLLAALARWGMQTPIRDVMHTRFRTARPEELAEEVLADLDESDPQMVLVINEQGRLVGVLTPQNLIEYQRTQEALRKFHQGKG